MIGATQKKMNKCNNENGIFKNAFIRLECMPKYAAQFSHVLVLLIFSNKKRNMAKHIPKIKYVRSCNFLLNFIRFQIYALTFAFREVHMH